MRSRPATSCGSSPLAAADGATRWPGWSRPSASTSSAGIVSPDNARSQYGVMLKAVEDPTRVYEADARQTEELRAELRVEPGELPNACERAVAEGAVGAPLVVVAHPVWQ